MGRYTSKDDETRTASDALSAPLTAQALEKTQISKYHTKGGHGFAAEDANNLADTLRGKTAQVVGTSNESNGADRTVNGIRLQSKYFPSASATVEAAFAPSSGYYRYEGQVLEVPRDQYEECLGFMRKRIAQGKVPGRENPADAEKIVQRGAVTYKQARNIARAGNVDSLLFDAKTQAVTCTYVCAISFAVTYAQSRWRGESTQDATTAALESAIKAGGTTFITGVVSAQLLRTRAAAIGVVQARSGVKAISGTRVGREAVTRIATGSLGKPVYGAAAVNHFSKLLRSNVVTGTIAVAVTSTPDFYRAAFDRSISWRQLTKNVTVNATGVATGTVGWMGGAAVGAAIGSAVPGMGTAAGGVAGGIVGALGCGVGGSAAATVVANRIVDDDSKRLLTILQDEIHTLAFEYMVTEDEVEHIASEVKRTATPKWLRRMFKETGKASDDGNLRKFVRTEFEPKIEAIIRKRPRITLPSVGQLEEEASSLYETMAADVKQDDADQPDTTDSVVRIQISRDSLAKLDELAEAGIVNSRSEAAAFLIGEGAAARSQLFERIAEKTEMIRKVKEELGSLVDEEPAEASRAPSGDKAYA